MSPSSRSSTPLHLMKFKFLLTLMLLTTLSPLSHAAVTINWGSEAFSTLLDSKGVPLDGSYEFQLGVFTTTTQSGTVPYVPQLTSLDDWASHWKVFDKADFNSIVDNGQTWSTFSSTVVLNNNGTSSYAGAAADVNFTGLDAYLWIHKPGDATRGGENLLLRAAGTTPGTTNWQFPASVADCCGKNLPIDWSVTDLQGSDVPVIGYQKGSLEAPTVGAGDTPPSGGYISYMETSTFVPEPCSAVMVMVLGLMGLLDRRRSWS